MSVKRQSNRSRLNEFLKSAKQKKLNVGWDENATYDSGVPVAAIAAQNEFGNPSLNIPPRPFFRPAIDQNKQEWSRQSAKGLKSSLDGKIALEAVFEALGLMVAGDVRKSISEVTSPPLAESTVKARLRGQDATKGARKPLVHTGVMIGSLSHEVKG